MKKGGYLFGGVFFLAGAGFFIGVVLSQLFDAINMQSWSRINAQLISVDVSSYQSRNDNGSYTTMYKLDASYQYEVNGRTFVGNRTAISTGSSSDQNEHYQLLSQLKNEQSRHGHIQIWVDPDDAAGSVYDRSLDVRLMLTMTLFCSIFMMIGGGIVVYVYTHQEEKDLVDNVDPNKPWTSRTSWASPIVYSQAESSVKFAWFFAALALVFFGTFISAMFGRHPVATGFAVVLAIIPALVIKRALRIHKEWKRFKRVPVTLNPYPGVIGGEVGGELVVPVRLSSGDRYTLTLACTRHWTTRSGNKTESHQSVVWTSEQTGQSKATFNGTGISFSFNVPAEQEPSSKPDNNYHRWTLAVKGEVEGVNFDRTYEIPVFVTQESQSIEEELEAQPLSVTEQQAINARLSVEQDGDTISMDTPGSQIGTVFAAVGGFFTVLGLLIFHFTGTMGGLFFSFIGSLFCALGLWIRGRNCKVQVSPNRCEVEVFWFSRKTKHHVLQAEDVKDIEIFNSSSSQGPNGQVSEKFDLRLNTTQGTRIDIGGEFKSKKNATHMKREIERVLGTAIST